MPTSKGTPIEQPTLWPQVPIEVRPARAPNGSRGVLLQLPDGYVVIRPEAARELGARLMAVADEVEDPWD